MKCVKMLTNIITMKTSNTNLISFLVQKMSIIKLYFKETEFIEEKNLQIPESEIAFLEINADKKEALLTYKPECKFVDKIIAERQAQAICKTGFLLENGERIGSGCNLVITS